MDDTEIDDGELQNTGRENAPREIPGRLQRLRAGVEGIEQRADHHDVEENGRNRGGEEMMERIQHVLRLGAGVGDGSDGRSAAHVRLDLEHEAGEFLFHRLDGSLMFGPVSSQIAPSFPPETGERSQLLATNGPDDCRRSACSTTGWRPPSIANIFEPSTSGRQ